MKGAEERSSASEFRLKTSRAAAFWMSCRGRMAPAGRPARRELQARDDQSLDLCCLLSEKGTYSPDVVQHLSTRVGCCSNVDSKGELTLECHTQVPRGLGVGYLRVVKGNSQVVGGRAFPWEE